MATASFDNLGIGARVFAVFALILGLAAAFAGLFVYSTWVGGFVLMKVWAWYIVPTFHLAPLTLVQAIGVSLVFCLVRGTGISYAKEEEDSGKRWSKTITALVWPWVILLIARLVLHFA